MQIYPAIDIKNGQCVRLRQGKFDDVTVYGDDPIKVAEKFVKSGATYLHIVDLDGARNGMSYNQEIIKEIVDRFNIPVQTGGGVRSMRDIEKRIALGVSRVILGTVAVKNPELVQEAVKVYGDKIGVGIDAVNGWVAIHGWEEISQVTALDLCMRMKDYGVKTIMYTDISKDGMMIGPNVEATKEIIKMTGVDIIASGGITTMMDLENLEAIGAHGTIIGKALYQGALKLSDVIARFEK
ncbi:MAG: 1-(5-phosphoribosyl)-5-[(5-phosphoribosylamino)methylideneamino]imidazole-4-carboxamide isomerase [Lachnospiraceae bacterium]|nr:1-(5-phosphoribosyl)-5-[(5-phosphoribosylamino)methylideneamino]imidazole-4-carboxamide isomerase [Lachnospiraceae bacterium]